MMRRCVAAQKMRELFSYKPSVYDTHFNEKKIIYVHIPKAAGTSLALALYSAEIWHYSAGELRFINQSKFKDYYKFSFVRNPWGRMYSTFKYAGIDIRKYGSGSPLEFIIRYKTFEEFILKGLSTSLVQENYFFWSQYRYLYINDQLAMDFVGKLETMDADIAMLQKQVQFNEKKVQKKNRTPQKAQLHEVYTDEMLHKVADCYSNDLQAFSYDAAEIHNYR